VAQLLQIKRFGGGRYFQACSCRIARRLGGKTPVQNLTTVA
jgi:hypothetical protein